MFQRYSELIKKEKEYGLTDEEYEELRELEFESMEEEAVKRRYGL